MPAEIVSAAGATGSFKDRMPEPGSTMRSSGTGSQIHPFCQLNESVYWTVVSVPSVVHRPLAVKPAAESSGSSGLIAGIATEVPEADCLTSLTACWAEVVFDR